jgi:N-acetylglucosaminyl-diphospho-decaprenol L-rhamnosyltransferase
MLSVITVCHKSELDLPRFVASFLLSGSGHVVEIEFVFVENSGNPHIETCLEPLRQAGFAVTFIMMENRGFGSGCNRGAALAQGEVLVFANPDLEFDNPIDPVEAIATHWGTVAQMTGEGRMQSFDILPERKSIYGELLRRYRRMTPPPAQYGHALVPIGSFFCIDRALFERVHGFDERFFLYHEEAELSRRLLHAVGPPAFLPDVRIIHHAFGSQTSSTATLGHEADGLLTYAVVTDAWRAVRTRALFLLLTAPVSAMSRLRLRQLWHSWRKLRKGRQSR